MHSFFVIFRKRFWRKYAVAGILIGFFLLAMSFYINGRTSIAEYREHVNGTYWGLAQEDGFQSEETVERINARKTEDAASQIFSMYVIMEYAYSLYFYGGNILLTLPVLFFFYERKRGYHQFVLTRSGSFYPHLAREGIATAAAGWLMALIPPLLLWGLAWVFSPSLLPLNQSFNLLPNALVAGLFQGNGIALAYLLYILLASLNFFFLALLAFAFALFVKRGVYLLFIPLLYTYLANIIVAFLEKYGYGFSFAPTLITSLSTFAPMLFFWFYTLLLALLILKVFAGKERIIHGQA